MRDEGVSRGEKRRFGDLEKGGKVESSGGGDDAKGR
jgi:hypothetical protein